MSEAKVNQNLLSVFLGTAPLFIARVIFLVLYTYGLNHLLSPSWNWLHIVVGSLVYFIGLGLIDLATYWWKIRSIKVTS